MSRAILFYVLLIVCCGCHRTQPESSSTFKTPKIASSTLQINTSKGLSTFEVEIAKTPESRSLGLMNRDKLDLNKGMVFIFDDDSNHSFWMKNTYIPLDLIFFDKDWIVVGFLENLEPLSIRSRSVDASSRFVLEVNAGLIKKLGIVKGNPAVLVEKEEK